MIVVDNVLVKSSNEKKKEIIKYEFNYQLTFYPKKKNTTLN